MLIAHYDWSGGREAMLRFGPATGPTVIAAPALFEEANRTRAFMVSMLRTLAERGIGGALPDLPGTNESLVPTSAATLADWRTAFAAAAARLPGPVYAIAIRGGALIDAEADLAGRWRLSPLYGGELTGEWRHAAIMTEAARGNRVTLAPFGEREEPLTIMGNTLSPTMVRQLAAATFAPGRTVRLASESAKADATVRGAPLWRRIEPDNDLALVQRLVDDIVEWIATCAT